MKESERRTVLLAIALLALVLRLIYIWQISYAPFLLRYRLKVRREIGLRVAKDLDDGLPVR